MRAISQPLGAIPLESFEAFLFSGGQGTEYSYFLSESCSVQGNVVLVFNSMKSEMIGNLRYQMFSFTILSSINQSNLIKSSPVSQRTFRFRSHEKSIICLIFSLYF